MKGKVVCKTHGGLSTGPKSDAGRQRCAEAKTIHGNEARSMRNARSLTVARLAALEALAVGLGMVTGMKRTRGPKPKQVVDIFDPLAGNGRHADGTQTRGDANHNYLSLNGTILVLG